MLIALIAWAVLVAAQPTGVRPVDPELRASLGFADPRAQEDIFREIESLPTEDVSRPETSAGWDDLRARNLALYTRRTNLISELEESGYGGEKLPALIRTKLKDVAWIASDAYGPMNHALSLLWEEQERHQNEPLSAVAKLYSIDRVLSIMSHTHLHVGEQDLAAIADAELLAASDPARSKESGGTLVNALRGQDAAVKEKWYNWAIEHLPADSIAVLTARREKAFDHPIQLEGPTLDDRHLDTKQWHGSVILVDFWGVWCGPCKERLPTLERLRVAYESRGLRLVGVLYDQAGPARKYLAEHQYHWPQIVDPENEGRVFSALSHPIARQYGVRTFPTLWLIDRDGILRRAPSDDAALEARIVELLDKPVTEEVNPSQ